jgi:hypothetical protein
VNRNSIPATTSLLVIVTIIKFLSFNDIVFIFILRDSSFAQLIELPADGGEPDNEERPPPEVIDVQDRP